MNIADVVLLVVVGLSALVGAFRGFTKELFGLVSWIGAGFATYTFFPLIRDLVRQHIENPMLSDVVGTIVVFLAFFIFFHIISHLLGILLHSGLLGSMEWSLGLIFGVFRGFFFLIILEILASYFVNRSQYPQTVRESFCIPYVFEGSNILFTALPYKVQEFFNIQKQKYEDSSQDFAKDFSAVNHLAILKPKISIPSDIVEYSKNTQQNMDRFLKQ